MRYEPDRCRLRELYAETGINQRMVHIITGISESQLSEYASNHTRMGLGTAVTIARALKLPSCEMLYTWKVSDKK
ncbi:helix-turn-helix domain-containing protein [Paenibacillus antibioticophila]|uniref:helix-turn-helix domain-containing protein n=1 Tax=Paenibacillus antibioticophila TaxID=1274374 RepID=UPI0005CB26FC|nr:helix-turn-helix transcriptional regulator [Paenibacillus antibioticophila]